MNSVCLVILNYNGVHHLEHLMPTLKAACAASPVPASVVVLDNRSTGPDVAWLAEHAPWARTVVSPVNDYLFSYNAMLAELEDDAVILLNNDMRVREDFIAPLLAHLESPDVFAASGLSYNWAGDAVTTGPVQLRNKNGFYGWPVDRTIRKVSHTFYCSGSCMAVDRRKFLEIGGFNRLYHPAYCEDLEICFQAWCRGWRCIYEPASVVWHREQSSWSISEEFELNELNLRNALIFQWACLPLEKGHQRAVARMILKSLFRGNLHWLKTWMEAMRLWRQRRPAASRRITAAELARINEAVLQPV